MTRMYARTLATVGAAIIVTTLSSMAADAQERVRWKMQSAFGSNLSHLGTAARSLRQEHRARVRRHVRDSSSTSPAPWSRRSSASMPRRKRLGRVVLDHPGLSHRQDPGAGLLHRRAVRSAVRRVLCLEDLRRRRSAQERDLRPAQPVLARLQSPSGRRPRAGSGSRSSSLEQLQGPQDALLRPRRPGHAEARRVDPAARRRRHLSGARARRDRRHRVLDARHGHRPRLLSGREEQLFPGLAPAGLGQRAADAQGRPGRPCPTSTRPWSSSTCGEQIHYNYAETEAKNPNGHEQDARGEWRHQIRRWTDEELAAFEEAWLEVLDEQSAAGPELQEGRRQLSRLPRELQDLGRGAVPEDAPTSASERRLERGNRRARAARQNDEGEVGRRPPRTFGLEPKSGTSMEALANLTRLNGKLVTLIAIAPGDRRGVRRHCQSVAGAAGRAAVVRPGLPADRDVRDARLRCCSRAIRSRSSWAAWRFSTA